jgi:CRP-like cAMP-binding protein
MPDVRMMKIGQHAVSVATERVATVAQQGQPPSRRHENRVLASLPPSELAMFARHLSVVSLPSGIVLQHQDRPPDFVYFPHDGLVSLLAVTPGGRTIEAASAGRGGAVCPILPSDLHDGFLTAVTHRPMRASRIAVGRLEAILSDSEALSRALDACRRALLLQLRQNLVCSGLHSVEHRLPRWLLETADRAEAETVSCTQEHVAQRLGVRRTTVTLLASKLQDADAIRWGRSRVEILDRAGLKAVACSCYAALRERMNSLLPPLDTTVPAHVGGS